VIGVNPYAKGLNFSGAVSLIGADLSFQFRRTSTPTGGGASDETFTGKLIPPGTASGTYRWDYVSNMNIWGIHNLHCSTGDITWSAS
jgi:hypothetical protein